MISTEVVEFPGGPLPLNSPFYVYRPPQEELVCQEVEKPGSAIRIQAPRKMGKSSLLTRLLAHAKAQGYGVAHIDFQEVDRAAFGSLDKLLRWLCANVSRRLRLLLNSMIIGMRRWAVRSVVRFILKNIYSNRSIDQLSWL
ncbi:AAA-like domain-containing protein [Kamptonema cortianum]|nr:AAA-like domain-containing protein [Kamptonema cortianum]